MRFWKQEEIWHSFAQGKHEQLELWEDYFSTSVCRRRGCEAAIRGRSRP